MMGKVNREDWQKTLENCSRKTYANDQYIAAPRRETLGRNPYVRTEKVNKEEK